MKRQRGRTRNNNNNSNRNNNNSNRSMDSNGPDVKVRGTASTIYEKYTTLARDAASSGNRVKAENYRQHAEHYLRLMNAQEAAKQEAREKAEAERAARGESNDDEQEGNSDTRRQPRNIHQKKRNREQNTETDNGSDTPDGLEVVTPEADAPKAKRSVKPKKVKEAEMSLDETSSEDVPKRRRRAPSRKSTPDADTVEAAE